LGLTEHIEIIESFENLGLSPNEARVYLALLENHPITGYQLSKISGILRPVVYEMLGRLVEKGGARIVKSNPDTYIPVEIEEFLRNIETDFTVARGNIAAMLSRFLVADESDYFWNILGQKNIRNSIISMIERAETEIYLCVQLQENFDPISEALHKKLHDGVKIDVFSYYSLDAREITLYSYNLHKSFTFEGIIPSEFILVCDGAETILANYTDQKSAKAVHSKNQVMVHTSKQHIIDSIYMIRLWKFIGTEKLKVLMTNEDRKLLEAIERHLGE
jgi:sugar-specific transcriptional regulator TrmB